MILKNKLNAWWMVMQLQNYLFSGIVGRFEATMVIIEALWALKFVLRSVIIWPILEKIFSHGTEFTIMDMYFFYKDCHTGVFDCLFFSPLQRVFFKIQCCFRKVFFHLMIYEYYLDVNVKKNCFKFYLETCTWLISRSWPWKSCPSF